MPRQPNNRMLVAVSDLFFLAKILDSAKRASMQVETVKTQEDFLEKAKSVPALIIFDLNFESLDPIAMITALKTNPEMKSVGTLAFVSHVQADLKMEAQNAGCDMVLARSAFSQNLPQILKRYSGAL